MECNAHIWRLMLNTTLLPKSRPNKHALIYWLSTNMENYLGRGRKNVYFSSHFKRRSDSLKTGFSSSSRN